MFDTLDVCMCVCACVSHRGEKSIKSEYPPGDVADWYDRTYLPLNVFPGELDTIISTVDFFHISKTY